MLFVNDQLYVRLSSGRVINIYDQFYGNKTIFKCLEVDVPVDLKKINSVWSPEKLNGVPLKIVKANPSWWRNLRLARSKVYMHLIAQVRMIIWQWISIIMCQHLQHPLLDHDQAVVGLARHQHQQGFWPTCAKLRNLRMFFTQWKLLYTCHILIVWQYFFTLLEPQGPVAGCKICIFCSTYTDISCRNFLLRRLNIIMIWNI